MKLALCTTTINIPHVLKLYRACDPGVKFFVALDEKRADIAMFPTLDPSEWLMPSDQKKWKCSELIGWNCVQRRNIAFLEALKWGADIIVSVDDDNLIFDKNYFQHFRDAFAEPFTGLMAKRPGGWFDPGQLLLPPIKQRGIPYGTPLAPTFYTPISGARIGVAAGIASGDADMDAATRMVNSPEATQIILPGHHGTVVAHDTHTVFNSQVTAVARELIPAWGMIPFVGRFDDIFASMICRRVMRERELYVRFGLPTVWQSRNEHNLTRDLRGEIDGYENVERLADVLDHITLPGKSVIEDCRRIWETLNHVDYIPGRSVSAMMAYLDDCEAIMSDTVLA